jgi:hypothetical protein
MQREIDPNSSASRTRWYEGPAVSCILQRWRPARSFAFPSPFVALPSRRLFCLSAPSGAAPSFLYRVIPSEAEEPLPPRRLFCICSGGLKPTAFVSLSCHSERSRGTSPASPAVLHL